MRRIIRIEVRGQVNWEVAKSSAGRWVGVCRPLGLTMEGGTLDELYENINESVQLLLSELMETGDLDRFLSTLGWRALPAPADADGPVEFDVPYEVLVRPARDTARALLQ